MSNHRTFADAFAHIQVPANILDEHVPPQQNENLQNENLVQEPVQVPVLVEIPVQVHVHENIESADIEEDEASQNNDFVVTIANIRDGIISNKTSQSYLGDITHFLKWVISNEADWLTDYGKTALADVFVQREDETPRVFRARSVLQLKNLLRDSFDTNIVHIDAITPTRYMDYILTLTGRGGNRHLTQSAYSNKRSALYHLYRLHNRIGFRERFRTELGNLYKGFFRTLTQHRHVYGQMENNNRSTHVGKEAMSVELFKCLCGWLLSYGTIDGVFANTYLILTWNLACRASNTANIRFKDISWSTCFDSFSIIFEHSKTDQLGEEAKYLRHLYANPNVPLVCPVLALSIYLSSSFNTTQYADHYLFPGKDQSKRFGKILASVLVRNSEAVRKLGFSLHDVGTHSIRKGAVSYLSSLPGGPPSAAICIRAGWTMGKIKDVYMRYVTSGDQFVGRCLCLLPILRVDFGCSPPYFVKVHDAAWLDELNRCQFPMIQLIAGLGRLSLMCLASIIYHRHWILSYMHVNHVFRVTCHTLRNGELLALINSSNNKDMIQVTHPWTDNNAFSGIPPHVSIMQQVTQVLDKQSQLVGDFIVQLEKSLEQMGIDGGRMSESNLKDILKNFEEKFINRIGVTQQIVLENDVEMKRVENGRTYTVHYYLNSYKRVPVNWRFPRCGVADLWRHWWIGDSVRQIPPLRMLSVGDVKHLDSFQLDEEEQHGRTGKNKTRRRMARKTLNDMNFLMKFVTDKVVSEGAYEEDKSTVSVDRMFQLVVNCFDIGARDAQKKWSTIVNDVRSKKIT